VRIQKKCGKRMNSTEKIDKKIDDSQLNKGLTD